MAAQNVVLITGVSSGIGEAIASLLSSRGYRVFGTARKPPAGPGGGPQDAEWVQLDVCDEQSVRSCLRTVLGRTGRIDALVNNAGSALLGSAEETTIEEAKELFETNFFGVLRMTAAILPIMREQRSGRIINISSVVAFVPAPYMGIYAASKRALEGYSESLDHEVRQFGIRVSTIEPGFTRTNLGRHSRLAGQPMGVYAVDRGRVFEAFNDSITKGEDPARIASVVANAIATRSPQPKYLAGRGARVLSLLQTWAPSRSFDRGLRKQFGLSDAVAPHATAAATGPAKSR